MSKNRIPEVKTLYEILPKGAESGKEFARIVDLLLFHEARRNGRNATIFNDVAGDYHGLDSFERGYFRKHEMVGYQYKFYPSPLSSKHRSEIEKSLTRAAETQDELGLEKWVLVTPQDLTESSTRKDGGDVTWFESLRKKLDLKFEIEHWGHRNLLSLFLETPSICLFYYPELVSDGATRKNTIQDTRERYNNNLNTLYRNIEFVGMSVYKQEATKGVPMEHIYIPLRAVPESADENDLKATHINPLSFLEPGARNIVLGDPGSGKSTLLRFLALAGLSKPLQERYSAKPDDRLPILITLRLYADELKSRKNLSLIDYIKEYIQGHFNLKDADWDFFEYYLESGKAILFFDGLDELPSQNFKLNIRDRIRTLTTTYPGNTTIVTSRIVGYENPFRFDDKEYFHTRLTFLQLPEIEQFVKDWYSVRIENKNERETYVGDLIRILRDEDHIAIRELAQNPLLLTIVCLVHRIDAVLPDERVVLYEKCTETLMNTWHTWKFREKEIRNKGKLDRRNRRRMEAIAHWMHLQSGSTDKNQRAVVKYADLKNFLKNHISEIERLHDPDKDPEDLADEFLEFVKERAGLLIEVGGGQYSFVHLTFQEYLTASYIKTSSERPGAEGTWEAIRDHCNDPRWNEVIRLLIADLRSDDSQEFILNKILSEAMNGQKLARSLLLGGFLIDGIETAEIRKEEIFHYLLRSASAPMDNYDQFRPIILMIRTFIKKDHGNYELMSSAFRSLWSTITDDRQRMALALIASSINWSEKEILDLIGDIITKNHQDAALFNFFLGETANHGTINHISRDIELFWSIQDYFSLRSAPTNFISAALQSVNFLNKTNIIAKRIFEEQMTLLATQFSGPFRDFTLNTLKIIGAYRDRNTTQALNLARIHDLDLGPTRDQVRARHKELNRDLALARHQDLIKDLDTELDREKNRKQDSDLVLDQANGRAKDMARDLDRDMYQYLDRKTDRDMYRYLDGGWDLVDFWPRKLATTDIYKPILELLCDIFALKPKAQWLEALRVGFLPKIPERITQFDEIIWENVEKAFEDGNVDETAIYSAAWQLLLDVWLWTFGYYESSDKSTFDHLANLTRERDEPPLRIAQCIRDIAFGNETRISDLESMVRSDDPKYRAIFETCLWRIPPK